MYEIYCEETFPHSVRTVYARACGSAVSATTAHIRQEIQHPATASIHGGTVLTSARTTPRSVTVIATPNVTP